jgi:hypothetical protein
MQSPSNTQRLLLRYLLDHLPPEERERVDEALITDQDFSDSFAEARNEWIDAYAAGSLSPEWKNQVEQALLNTPDGQSSLRVAAALHSQPATVPIKTPKKFPSRAVLSFLAPALAACLVLVFWLHSGQSTRPVVQSSPASSSPAVADVKPLSPPAAEAPPTQAKAPAPQAPRAGILALVMPAATLRGTDAVPLPLKPAINRVQVQWPLPEEAAAAQYTLEVAGDTTATKKYEQHGPVKTIGNTRIATFLLPAAILSTGQYTFALYAGPASESAPLAQTLVTVSH